MRNRRMPQLDLMIYATQFSSMAVLIAAGHVVASLLFYQTGAMVVLRNFDVCYYQDVSRLGAVGEQQTYFIFPVFLFFKLSGLSINVVNYER